MPRYQVADEFDDNDQTGREVDLNAKADNKKVVKSDSDFDELDRGTFRNEPNDEPRGRQERDDEDTEDEDLEVDEDEDDDVREARLDTRNRETDQNMRKRLARERRLREESDEEADFYRNRADDLDRRLQKIEQKVDAGNTVKELEAEASKLDDAMAKVKVKLKAAKEAGDVDLEISLSEEMASIGGDLKVNAFKIGEARKAASVAKETTTQAPPNRHLAKWLRQHAQWYNDPAHKQIAAMIEKEVMATGSDVRTAEHFQRIDNRLSKLYPKEFKPRNVTRTRRSPVNGGESDEGTRSLPGQRKTGESIDIQVRNGKAFLTPNHERIMRDFGLDPEDPSDVNDFVRQNVRKK